jgi:NAD(P)-dependent dehydrogenase (short-subunit alcohol dehydrogenase family)
MVDRFDLTGRCVLVTGASSGIGRHAAGVFAEAGANVAVAARRRDRLDDVVAEITRAGGTAYAVALDVTDEPMIGSVLDEIETQFAPIDVLFNNAGMTISKPPFAHAAEDWRAVIDTNLNGAWFMASAVAQRMAARPEALPPGGGSIINTTSIGATRTMPRVPAYMASKAGLAHLTRQMAMEWAPMRIRVNAIAPGFFVTEMSAGYLETDRGKAMLETVPMRRAARAEEMDGALLLLASDAGSYMTGSEIIVDGGVGVAP